MPLKFADHIGHWPRSDSPGPSNSRSGGLDLIPIPLRHCLFWQIEFWKLDVVLESADEIVKEMGTGNRPPPVLHWRRPQTPKESVCVTIGISSDEILKRKRGRVGYG